MSLFLLYSLVAIAIFVICLHALITKANLFRKILALNMIGSAVFLLLISLSWRNQVGDVPDPVPQAMVLTGIVVAVSTTAVALSLVRRLHAETGRIRFNDEDRSP